MRTDGPLVLILILDVSGKPRGNISRLLLCLRRTELLKNGNKSRDGEKQNDSKNDLAEKGGKCLSVYNRQPHRQPRRSH